MDHHTSTDNSVTHRLTIFGSRVQQITCETPPGGLETRSLFEWVILAVFAETHIAISSNVFLASARSRGSEKDVSWQRPDRPKPADEVTEKVLSSRRRDQGSKGWAAEVCGEFNRRKDDASRPMIHGILIYRGNYQLMLSASSKNCARAYQ